MSDAQISNASELNDCLGEKSIGFPVADLMMTDQRRTTSYVTMPLSFAHAQRQSTKEQRIFNSACRD